VKVLGIDPGTAACGYGIVHESDGRLRAVEFGSWKTAAGDPLEQRLLTIYERVEELIGAHAPAAVALE
jgi:crossover junction endodeoxyribonuclease RuvC